MALGRDTTNNVIPYCIPQIHPNPPNLLITIGHLRLEIVSCTCLHPTPRRLHHQITNHVRQDSLGKVSASRRKSDSRWLATTSVSASYPPAELMQSWASGTRS